MALIYNATFDKNTRKLSFEDRAGNEIYSFTVPERAPAVDDITKPLTLKATQDGSTVTLIKYGSPTGTFQTSSDGGSTWTDYTIGSKITLNTGDEVSFRAKYNRTKYDSGYFYYFGMTGKIEAWHNVMSLYRTNDFATYESVIANSFYRLFKDCTSLTKAPVLPATTLATQCYAAMFEGCQSLAKAPVLPATTLANYCYFAMFNGCQSLTKAPELPATTLAQNCYHGMFSGCGSLNEVHCKMPSTISAEDVPNYTGSGKTAWLSNVSATGTFYTNADANWPSGSASGIPQNWTRVNEDDITKPLTFRATQDGSTVALKRNGSPSGSFQTSRDGGNTWVDYTPNTDIALNTGDEVSFRAKSDRTSNQNSRDYFYFVMTGKIEAWHNIMSLYRTNDFATYESVVEYAFNGLFDGCTSLTKAPALPATKLAWCCYRNMFSDCQSLTEAPELPATKLAESCYQFMFYHCQSLKEAPELPATTLADNCYYGMFYECQSLKEVRISATNATTSSLNNWLKGVSARGDFYCDPNATIFPSGTSGIPQNWTRRNIADYPN